MSDITISRSVWCEGCTPDNCCGCPPSACQVYSPFPTDSKPEGWPDEMVELADYERLSRERDRYRAALQQISGFFDPSDRRTFTALETIIRRRTSEALNG